MMVAGTGTPASFDQKSTLFGSINEKMDEAYCEVYAPMVWDSPTERKKVVTEIRERILSKINDLCETRKVEN